MTDNEINLAIAEILGWTELECGPIVGLTGVPPKGTESQYKPWNPVIDDRVCYVPNYAGDLNAMHEAEQQLFYEQHFDTKYHFVVHLAIILNPVHGYKMTDGVDLLDATARQRAEAFIRTVGKWRE